MLGNGSINYNGKISYVHILSQAGDKNMISSNIKHYHGSLMIFTHYEIKRCEIFWDI
jgi:hypothetical protein